MKKIILTLSILALAASCLPEQKTVSTGSSSNDNTVVTDTTGTNGSNTTSSGGTTDGSSTTGSTGSGFPPYVYPIALAGEGDDAQSTEQHKDSVRWYPKDTQASTFITPREAGILFQTDNLLRVRLKIKPQGTSCYGRNTGSPMNTYTKLQFDIHLRNITCPGGGTSCDPSQYILGPRYYSYQSVGPVNVGSYSQIFDFSNRLSTGVVATTVEIDNVSSDNYCLVGGSNEIFCPARRRVRTMDCWGMDLEVQTSYTQSF